MHNTRTNINIHFDSMPVPSINEYDNFYTFKINTGGNEIVYFFMNKNDLSEFLNSLKNLEFPLSEDTILV